MTSGTADFLETLWEYYASHGRHDLPWRQPEADGLFDPYKIMVSELMLQQTQVQRVIPKFHEFLMKFPTVQSLAAVQLADVLVMWSGLGYNRWAKFLWQAAQMVVKDYNGVFPQTIEALTKLPGVGKNTAGAIAAYAFNKPVAFIETNVRTVYIHHFFQDETDVPDTDIMALVETTLDREQAREFYWAIMDYGSHLKRTVGNLSRHSKTYAKQSAFAGSRRQVRGAVLRGLAQGGKALPELVELIDDERLESVLNDLVSEELVRFSAGKYSL